MTASNSTGYVLNAALPVLLRPDGVVQVGWNPLRAVLVRPPQGLSTTDLAGLLRSLQSGGTLADLGALTSGLADPAELADLVAALMEAGVVAAQRQQTRTASIRIHGRGPLSDLLVSGLR